MKRKLHSLASGIILYYRNKNWEKPKGFVILNFTSYVFRPDWTLQQVILFEVCLSDIESNPSNFKRNITHS